ncbi:uncharacterized protein LOC128546322 [Mercenaria mercenaria]|uniref:uncharacterized protein LOC128546322 n=1 Tax=Mercenaria mercenaria TaxID=6596 RepID=UPI00234F59B8|nr:uncharacterized protein LOC128546322 [Mercenaria mercenaria]
MLLYFIQNPILFMMKTLRKAVSDLNTSMFRRFLSGNGAASICDRSVHTLIRRQTLTTDIIAGRRLLTSVSRDKPYLHRMKLLSSLRRCLLEYTGQGLLEVKAFIVMVCVKHTAGFCMAI